MAAGVNRNTISDIERRMVLSKSPTLRRIADGLATYAPGRRDQELADAYYQRLMRAAGYLTDPGPDPSTYEIDPRRPVEDLTDEEVREVLSRISRDPAFSAHLLSAAEEWADMSPEAQRFLLNGF